MKIINEDKKKVVFASKQVVVKNELITNVFYDNDADWIFFHTEKVKEEDVLILSIEQIINLDKTLLSLPDMRVGEKVKRLNKNELWEKY